MDIEKREDGLQVVYTCLQRKQARVMKGVSEELYLNRLRLHLHPSKASPAGSSEMFFRR